MRETRLVTISVSGKDIDSPLATMYGRRWTAARSTVYSPSSKRLGGSGWESNPPRPATRPATGFEDQEIHRDLTTPVRKDNREKPYSQVMCETGNILNE